ncbi:group I truncated hemoglobin [Oceanobacillus alkalisoli]|uniref:group I truncated hemoglobin n=1 Tax=Oceanobacillus alkalisoli TaxID=2925113 RepID=UPI001EE469A9|nr:group 1 truncated hemoglobin [Oceanobacillus alkalisoli]MCG5103237.1 group 1 truncated hemoglobin [Oceanobacillus alkalisoli]
MAEQSLYERLGGIYKIAAVVDHFGDALASDPIVGENSANSFLKDWYANKSWRGAGFKVLTTLWVSEKAGGPYHYVSTEPNQDSLDLEPTHYDMKLTEEEFDAAGQLLAETLDHFDVPDREKNEVLDAFMAHKNEVISGTIK